MCEHIGKWRIQIKGIFGSYEFAVEGKGMEGIKDNAHDFSLRNSKKADATY